MYKKVLVALLLVTLSIASILPREVNSNPDKDVVVLTTNNTLVLDTPISFETVPSIILKARELDAKVKNKSKPVYLVINSPGGDIDAGFQLIDSLNSIQRPIHTISIFAASMAFQTVQALGDRLMTPHGQIMSHRASGGFEGTFGGPKGSQLESRYHFWLQRLQELDIQTVKRSQGKQTLESYQNAYANELWLSGVTAVEGGYADRTVKVRCDDSLVGTSSHESDTLFGHVTYETDKCPTNTGILNVKLAIATNQGTMDYAEFKKLGGSYGPDCLVAASVTKKICALDTSLTDEKINKIKSEFVDTVIRNKNHIIPLSLD